MISIEKRMAELQNRKRRTVAQIEKLQARLSVNDRKREVQRKILLGITLMRLMNEDPQLLDRVMRDLDQTLTRNIDREMFGLKARSTNGNQGK